MKKLYSNSKYPKDLQKEGFNPWRLIHSASSDKEKWIEKTEAMQIGEQVLVKTTIEVNGSVSVDLVKVEGQIVTNKLEDGVEFNAITERTFKIGSDILPDADENLDENSESKSSEDTSLKQIEEPTEDAPGTDENDID